VPIRGNGLNNFECYLAPGVFDPPCFYYNSQNCVLINDLTTCQSGKHRAIDATPLSVCSVAFVH
jgi:hypothetical protein